jgi:hypothetical protein
LFCSLFWINALIRRRAGLNGNPENPHVSTMIAMWLKIVAGADWLQAVNRCFVMPSRVRELDFHPQIRRHTPNIA